MAGEPESLMSDEDLTARDRRHGYDRLIMLSDGVFAIAITLLAFDIRPPAGWDRQLDSLWPVLAPELSAFVMSFLVISFYWLLHRRFVAMIRHVDALATGLNLALLGLIALIPAATRLAEDSRGALPVLGLYSALVVAIGAAEALFWGYAAFFAKLTFAEVGRRQRWVGFLTPLLSPPAMLLATVATGVPSGLVPYMLVMLFVLVWILFQRLMRPAPPGGAVPQTS